MRISKTLLALSLSATFIAPQMALAVDNGAKEDVGPGTVQANQGHFICTAAINSNGTIANALAGTYIHAPSTTKLGVGTYQVGFRYPCHNVRAVLGWFRIVQPDTLTTGALPARSCTVADRAGVPNAIWVQCFTAGGALVDTSFTISVSR